MKIPRIGIDNYCLHPLKLDPFKTLQWAKDHGAQGVQFSGVEVGQRGKMDNAYLKDLAQFAASHGLYLEWGGGQHIPYDMRSWQEKDLFEINRKAAIEAMILETGTVRSCSGGLMRWSPDSPSTETLLKETARCLRAQRQMLRDHNVILALETHFEFTTHELLRLFERCEAEPGEYLGICLDTMNLLTMLEDPVSATTRILPWVVMTHIKDGAALLGAEGITTFPMEIGRGVIELKKIVKQIAILPRQVNLSIEDHGGSFSLPIFDPLFLSKFPDVTAQELVMLLEHTQRAVARKIDHSSCCDRELWPGVCEERVARDIQALRGLISSAALGRKDRDDD